MFFHENVSVVFQFVIEVDVVFELFFGDGQLLEEFLVGVVGDALAVHLGADEGFLVVLVAQVE